MNSRTRHPREDEQFALETIEAVEDVVSHRWLEVADGPTPDIEVTRSDGLTVAVEITMSTDGAERSLRASFNDKSWPNAALACEWWVVLADHRREARGRRRNIQALLDDLTPVLENLEGVDCEHEEICELASRAVAGFAHPDWDLIVVVKCDPSGGDTGGGIRTWVAPVDGVWIKAVDVLVEAVQARINAKTARGQLCGYSSPKWLVVVLDSGTAAMQLEAAFTSEGRLRRPAEIDAIVCKDFDEVWVIGECISRSSRRNVLRLFASDASWKWQTVESDAWISYSHH